MLLLDGKEFNTSASSTGHEIQFRHYTESIVRIRELYGKNGQNDALTLIRRKERTKNKSGLMDIVTPEKIPAKAYCKIQLSRKDKNNQGVGGTEEWAFTRQRPILRDDRFEPSPIDITLTYSDAFSLTDDIDLLYFLLYKSPKVYFLDAIVNGGKAKKGAYIVDDSTEKAKLRLQREREDIEVKAQIMAVDNKYPLYADKEMRKIAQAWGIGEAMNEGIDAAEVRLFLYDNVIALQKAKEKSGTGRGISEFYDLIKQDFAVQIRSLIGYAINKKYVVFDDHKGAFIYSANDEEIVSVPPKDRGEERSFDYLYNYLTNDLNVKYLDLFKRETLSREYLNGLSFEDLKFFGKDIGLSLLKKSGEKLKDEIEAYYSGEVVSKEAVS